jgi:hypothetical protein
MEDHTLGVLEFLFIFYYSIQGLLVVVSFPKILKKKISNMGEALRILATFLHSVIFSSLSIFSFYNYQICSLVRQTGLDKIVWCIERKSRYYFTYQYIVQQRR